LQCVSNAFPLEFIVSRGCIELNGLIDNLRTVYQGTLSHISPEQQLRNTIIMRLDSRNDALAINGNTVNGATADIAITTRGSDWYWAVCAVMTVSTLAFLGLAFTKPRSHRLFHYITAGVTMVAAIAYFSMASNLGWTPIAVQYPRSDPRVHGTYREIFYVRYIDW
jgi:bacteriorhodopsin